MENIIQQVYRFKAVKLPFFILLVYFIFMTSGHSIAQEEETEQFADFPSRIILKMNTLPGEAVVSDSVNQFSEIFNDSKGEYENAENKESISPGETLGWRSFSKVLP